MHLHWLSVVILKSEIIGVPKSSQYFPRCFVSASLNEQLVKKQETCICQLPLMISRCVVNRLLKGLTLHCYSIDDI